MTCDAKNELARAPGAMRNPAKRQATATPMAIRRRRFIANGAAMRRSKLIPVGSGIGVIPKMLASSLKTALTKSFPLPALGSKPLPT